METLIEVEIVETGDTAVAETAEGAVFAARTMARDYADAFKQSTTRLHARFTVDGEVVRTELVKRLALV